MTIAGMLAVPNEPVWLVLYDERPLGISPSASQRYAYLPISPRGYPGWAVVRGGAAVWRLFTAVLEKRSDPLAKDGKGAAEWDAPPPVAGQDFWLPRGARVRVVYPVLVGASEMAARLTLTLDLAQGRLGLSRDDMPPSSALVRPIDATIFE